jgi:hypothetical protein
MAEWPYNTTRWQKLRAAKLATDPLCEDCLQIGQGRRGEHGRSPACDQQAAIRFRRSMSCRASAGRATRARRRRGAEAGAPGATSR